MLEAPKQCVAVLPFRARSAAAAPRPCPGRAADAPHTEPGAWRPCVAGPCPPHWPYARRARSVGFCCCSRHSGPRAGGGRARAPGATRGRGLLGRRGGARAQVAGAGLADAVLAQHGRRGRRAPGGAAGPALLHARRGCRAEHRAGMPGHGARARCAASPAPPPAPARAPPCRDPCHACRLRRLPGSGGAGAGRQASACPERASSNKTVLVCASSAHLWEKKAHSVWCRAARAPRRPTERPLRRWAPSQSTRT